jgi:hypothetical protein
MGAAMTGLRPVAELMFADFVSVCHDMVVNQVAKARYMTNGQVKLAVVRFGNGGGLRFGAQHSQSVENWLMAVPGLKVVVPSTPADVVGLMAAAVRDDDPVMFLEEKALYPTSGEVPEGEHLDELGTARVRRQGSHATVVALGTMAHRALAAAEVLATEGTDCEVVDLRSLVPLAVSTVAGSVSRTGRLFTVEDSPWRKTRAFAAGGPSSARSSPRSASTTSTGRPSGSRHRLSPSLPPAPWKTPSSPLPVLPSAVGTAWVPRDMMITGLNSPACTYPYERFAAPSRVADASLGATVVC